MQRFVKLALLPSPKKKESLKKSVTLGGTVTGGVCGFNLSLCEVLSVAKPESGQKTFVILPCPKKRLQVREHPRR